MPDNPTLYIDNNDALADYCQRLAASAWLALDTEFVRERTYFPQLCLIQAVGCDGQIACIDTLAIEDLSPLFALFTDPAITKILHAVSQDLEVFYQNGAPQLAPLFDTQLAAGFLGLGDQIGYAGLVQQLCNVELAKGHARTDWSRRPLSAEQLRYAADDVRYLGAMYEKLVTDLTEAGRDHWLAQDMEKLSRPASYEPDPQQAWRRLKGLGRLPADAQHRAAALAEWREQRAVARNLPRRWVLADAPLLELANQNPSDKAALAQIAELPAKLIEKKGDELLGLLAGVSASDTPLTREWARPTPEEKATQKRLKATLREVSEELDITPSLLATRNDIEGLGQGRRNLGVLEGWRAEVIGARLLSALEAS